MRYYFCENQVMKLSNPCDGIRTDVSFEEFKASSKVHEMSEKDCQDRLNVLYEYVKANREVSKAKRNYIMLKMSNKPFEEAKLEWEALALEFKMKHATNPWIEERVAVFSMDGNDDFESAEAALRAIYDCELEAAKKLLAYEREEQSLRDWRVN